MPKAKNQWKKIRKPPEKWANEKLRPIFHGIRIYYFLNKKLTLGVFEIGGSASGIEIKRSVIEGHKLDEKDAENVGSIIQHLIETKN
jgi:hypothetical protein